MKHFNETHGHAKAGAQAPEYYIWCAMKARCHAPSSSGYAKYGAKGTTVCERWRFSFENFLADMGHRPSPAHSIDRIDTLGNYEPENCRWATLEEQANNKTSNRIIDCDGRRQTLAQWSRESGVDADVISLRITKHGWPIRDAIFTRERKASSGIQGVYYQAARRKWNVYFMRNGKRFNLGRFDCLLDAAAARLGNAARSFL